MKTAIKRLAVRTGLLVLTFLVTSGIAATVSLHQTRVKLQEDLIKAQVQYQRTESDRAKLEQQADSLKSGNEDLQRQLEAKKQQESDLQQEISRLKQAKANASANVAQASSHVTLPAGDVQNAAFDALAALGQAQYFPEMSFIFQHESGWQMDRMNSIGCYGLGQSCPFGSQMAKECPAWRTDVACQVRHFTGYAQRRRGGWTGAYEYWLVHKNW